MKFDFISIFQNLKKIQVLLKSGKSNKYFTGRCMYIYDNVSLNSSYNEKCLGQKL
jgi:hypothetical protein